MMLGPTSLEEQVDARPGTTNILVYHLIESKYSGLANKNAADFKGDVGFIFNHESFCNPNNPEMCLENNVFEASIVNVTGWAPLEVCSAPGRTGAYACSASSSNYCCVGSDPNDVRTVNNLPGLGLSQMPLGNSFGFPGWWFSFPAQGQKITWNETILRRVQGKCVGNAWRREAGGCAHCGGSLDRCVAECIRQNLMKDGSTTRLQHAWDGAFGLDGEHSCPNVLLPDGSRLVEVPEAHKFQSNHVVCENAFRHQCYDESPFDSCCGDCSGAASSMTCTFSFHGYDHSFNGSFDFEWGSEGCDKACEEFNDSGNQLQDYCEGGPARTTIQECPAAEASLTKVMPVEWCPVGLGNVTCRWEHFRSPFINGSVSPRAETVAGNFSFFMQDHKCSSACRLLGEPLTPPEHFCRGGEMENALGDCPAALTSLQKVQIPHSWCLPGVSRHERKLQAFHSTKVRKQVDVPVSPYSFLTELADFGVWNVSKREFCKEAFIQSCFDAVDWHGCCDNCKGMAHAEMTCSFSIQRPGTSKRMQSHYLFQTNELDCFETCSEIGSDTNDNVIATDWCPGGSVYKTALSCPQAVHAIAKLADWCKPMANEMSAKPIQPWSGVIGGIVALSFLAALVLVSCSRRRPQLRTVDHAGSNVDNYVNDLPYRHLA